MKATIDVPEERNGRVKAKSALEGRATQEVGYEVPPWFGSARKYLRTPVADHGLGAIRRSIEKGWAEEVAAREVALGASRSPVRGRGRGAFTGFPG